jgi:hypothetical protein
MWRLHVTDDRQAHAVALEAAAAHAGDALACVYSSSAEYDAALIRARRAAGVYGPKRTRRHILLSAVALLTAATAVSLFLL